MARGWAMSRERRANVEAYLRIRRGFKLDGHARLLSAFIDHLELHRGIDTDRRGRAAVGHPAAGHATVPVEATTVGGARIRTLPARPRPRSAGAAKAICSSIGAVARRPT